MIVGFGPIGQEIAKRAKAFGASVSAVRRSQVKGEHVDAVGTLSQPVLRAA